MSYGVSSWSQPFTYNIIFQLSGRPADIVLTLSLVAVIGSRIGGTTKCFRCGLLYTTGGTVRSIFVTSGGI
nr:MAG TPA: C2H2 type zinc-finger protein [Bacteriophage sp.]